MTTANREVCPAFADWEKDEDRQALVFLLDEYARDPMGGGEGLSEDVKARLPATLAATPGAFSVIGWYTAENRRQPVALANCFRSVSTFACLPLINIHDLTVLSAFRSRGVGQAMLAFVEAHARELGCCKITLEVLSGNNNARRAYKRFGFAAYSLDENTGEALFYHKPLI